MVRIVPTTTTLSTRDARRLASFYEALLGWRRTTDEPGWVVIAGGDTAHRIAFHEDIAYEQPEWPSRAGRQQMQVHLELGADDVGAAVAHAIACGARLAEVQPQESVRVMLDPDGHPFCLFPADLGPT